MRSTAGQVEAPVELTDAIMPGVVSIPHGWGHDEDGVRLGVASAHAGVNSNVLADESLVDPLSGNAVLNGIPVEVAPLPASDPIRRLARMKGHGSTLPPRARGGAAAGPPDRRAQRRRGDLPRVTRHVGAS